MRLGKKNDTAEVKKLQKFLNDELKTSLPINGIFGKQTDAAVRKFQAANVPQVLTPWGITDPTGYVYKTTQRWINLTYCSTLNIPMPELN
jgi:peptidoglycan hydrolase-like protein with peptidoglycan-binding domain